MKHLLILPLTLFALAALRIGYAADDWCEALWRREYGLGVIRYLYDTWTGKFSYAFQIGLYKELLFPGLTALIALGLWGIALWLLVRRLDAALLLPASTIAVSPYAIDAFLWQSGAFGYAMGLALTTGLIVLVVHDKRFLALLLAFVAAGTTDTLAVVLPVLLVILWLLLRRGTAWYALIGALAALAVMLAAPGNAIRQSYFPGSEPLLAVWFALRTTGVPLAHALRTEPVLVIALLVLPALSGGRYAPDEQVKPLLLVLLVGVLTVNFAAEFASYYAVGVPLTGRAEPIPVYLSLLFGMAASALAGQRWALARPRLAQAAMALLIVLAAVHMGLLAAQVYQSGLGLSNSGAETCMVE